MLFSLRGALAFGPLLFTFPGPSLESTHFWVILQYNCLLKPVAKEFHWGSEAVVLMKSLGQGLANGALPGRQLPPLPSTKGAGGAFFWGGRSRPLFGLGIFTFHSLPQIDGNALYLTVTCCLHRRPQTLTIQAVKITSCF